MAMKPCPFCGTVPDVIDLTCGLKWVAVSCCCVGPRVRIHEANFTAGRAAAIAAWNDRAVVAVPGPTGAREGGAVGGGGRECGEA